MRDFYTTTTKQILDIHEEARRIADEHKASRQSQATGPTSAEIPGATDALTTDAPKEKEKEASGLP